MITKNQSTFLLYVRGKLPGAVQAVEARGLAPLDATDISNTNTLVVARSGAGQSDEISRLVVLEWFNQDRDAQGALLWFEEELPK